MQESIGVTRDADAQALVDAVRAAGQPPLSELGVLGARAYLEHKAAAAPAGPPVNTVLDEVVALTGRQVNVRVYRPDASSTLPVVVYFHGGGWVIGSIEASDAFCRRLVDAASCVLVSVEYRLAPEHPFPAGVEDAVGAIEWTADKSFALGGDPGRLIVLGDSAGGNIAAVASRRLRTRGRQLVARQILAYPSVAGDGRHSPNGHGSEWPLTDADRAWFITQYVPEAAMRADPDVAPLHADATGMPPTTLLVGGCDPLAPEGLAYADHLAAAGVSVDLHLYTGQIHGFLTLDESVLPRSREALEVVAAAIRNTGRR